MTVEEISMVFFLTVMAAILGPLEWYSLLTIGLTLLVLTAVDRSIRGNDNE